MAKKTLTLTERPCHIGNSINTRTEKHGDEDVPAADVPLTGLMLKAAELDKLLGDGAHERLFVKGTSGALEPALADIGELKFAHKFADCQVTLEIEGETTTFADVKVSKISLQPQVGGLTHMSCAVQTRLDVLDAAASLVMHMGKAIRAQIALGAKASKADKQQNLALNEGEDGEDETPAPKGGNGRPAAGAH